MTSLNGLHSPAAQTAQVTKGNAAMDEPAPQMKWSNA
jgi:hypothetical protein